MLLLCLTSLATRPLDKVDVETKLPKVPKVSQKQFDDVLGSPLRQPPTPRKTQR